MASEGNPRGYAPHTGHTPCLVSVWAVSHTRSVSLLASLLTHLSSAWTVEEKVPVYWPCIVLFLTGLSYIWMYSSVSLLSGVPVEGGGRSCGSYVRGLRLI